MVASGAKISHDTGRDDIIVTGRGRSRSVSELYPLRVIYGSEPGRYYPSQHYFRHVDSDLLPTAARANNIENRIIYHTTSPERRYYESPTPVRKPRPPVYVMQQRHNVTSRPMYLPGGPVYYVSPRHRYEEEIRARRTDEYVTSTLSRQDPNERPATVGKITSDRWGSVEPFSVDTTQRSRSGIMDESALFLQWEPEWADRNIKYGFKASSVC